MATTPTPEQREHHNKHDGKHIPKKQRKRHASPPSVQRQFMPVREIIGSVLVLTSSSGQQRDYCSVIEVVGTNFHLRSEEEQAALVEGFRVLLKALSFPVQILIKNQQLDLAPYLARVEGVLHDPERGAMHHQLAQAHKDFVVKLASQRTLLERRFYIVVPAGEASLSLSTVARLFGRTSRRKEREEALEGARKHLDLRTE